MHLFRKYLLAAFCAAALCAAAQETPRIRNFTPPEYGAQNQNWAATQTPQGWIYVGNNAGLLEFDGARWRQYYLPEKQTVRAAAIGRNGEVFCGGFAEFGFWKNDEKGRLAYTSLSTGLNSGQLGKEEIWHILVLPDAVLFQTFSTIYRFDYRQVEVLKPPSSIMFVREVDGRVLVPVIDRGLYELMPDNTFRFLEHTGALKGKIVQFLVPDGQGRVWAGTTNHGIFVVDGQQCLPWNNPLNQEFQKCQLNKAFVLKNGGWAIGTILNGAYILDARGRVRFHLHRGNGLQNNTVLSVVDDHDGNLWLGLDRGLDFVALQSPLTIYTDQTGKLGTVYAAAEHRGYLYVGTNQGVFVRPAADNDATTGLHDNFRLVEGTQGQVWELQVLDDQLVCGHNSGAFLIEAGKARKISDITGGWSTVRLPGHPELLLQSTYTGLVVFRKGPDGKWQFARRIDGFPEPLKKIVFDAGGHLCGVHPNKGLFYLEMNDSLTRVLKFRTFTREDGLPTDHQLDLAVWLGEILVNTAVGTFRIDLTGRASRNFEPFFATTERRKFLPGNEPEYFLADGNGIWMSDGQQTDYFSLPLVPLYEHIVALSENKYLFCLENGFALLDKRQLRQAGSSGRLPGAFIRTVETAPGASVLPDDGLTFGWEQNNLTFYYGTAFFERPPKFSWYLEGYSTAWSPWQTTAEKEFNNLPAGRYTFRVRTDQGGPEASVTFRIAPPWYRSGWAIAAYGLLVVTLFLGMEKVNRMRLERQRRRLDAEKRNELERQRAEAEREKLLLEVENKSRELSNAALNLIRKNEVLQRLKDDLHHSKNDPRGLHKIIRLIDEHLEGDHDWEIFEESFNRVHDDFFKRLMHDFPDLTPGDLRLAAYLKMNLSSKEIAPLFNISVRGVENKRYRLRKKLGLPEEANLTEFIMNF